MLKTTIIELLVFFFMYCSILNGSVQEELLYTKSCFQLFNISYCKHLLHCQNQTICIDQQNKIQQLSAQWGIYLAIANQLPAVFITVLFGTFSDKFGRKIFLLLPVIGLIISNSGFALVAFYDSLSIYYLLIGNFAVALFGGDFTFLSSCFAVAADLTTESNRTKRIIILQSMIGLSAVVASVTGGFIVGILGFFYVYFLICGLYVLQIVYWFFLKETNGNISKKFKFSMSEIFGENGLKGQMQTIFINDVTVRRCVILALFTISFFTFCFFGNLAITVKYVLHTPLNFNPQKVGYLLATIGVTSFVSTIITNIVCIHRYKWKDTTVLLIGCFGLLANILSYAFSKTVAGMFTSASWILLYGGAVPCNRSLLSKLFNPADQGKVFAMIASLESLSSLLSNVTMGYIYKQTVSMNPSCAYFIMASITAPMIIAAIMLIVFKTTNKYKRAKVDPEKVHLLHPQEELPV